MAGDEGEKPEPVITPGGPRPAEQAHYVAPGQAVQQNPDGTLSIVGTANDERSPRMADDDELVVGPGGYRPRSQTHLIEQNAVLDLSGGRIKKLDQKGTLLQDLGEFKQRQQGLPVHPRNIKKKLSEAAGQQYGSGWITYADWINSTGQPVSYFATTWNVPPPPTNTSGNQIIFLFNGLENQSWILQPVLQWGVSAAGGGQYWSIGSWFVDGQGGAGHFTKLTPVNPTDRLIGAMVITGSSPFGGFNYQCGFAGYPDSMLTVNSVDQLWYAVQVLEAYQITGCGDYPNTSNSPFWNIDLKVGYPPMPPTVEWTAVDNVTDCGQHTVIVSNANFGGEVDIYYNNSSDAGAQQHG
jgi:hypothetical protein